MSYQLNCKPLYAHKRLTAVPTNYIIPELFRASLISVKGDLLSKHREVSTLRRPVILDYHLNESWKFEEARRKPQCLCCRTEHEHSHSN